MKYFLMVQNDLNDTDPDINGPFRSAAAAEKSAEVDYEPESGCVFTVLSQEGTKFKQVSQAVISLQKYHWIR